MDKSRNFMLLREGPSLFNISLVSFLFYDFSQEALIQAQGFSYQRYAGNIQNFITSPDLSSEQKTHVSNCLPDTYTWIFQSTSSSVKPKLNP